MIHFDVYVVFTGTSYEFACQPEASAQEVICQILQCLKTKESLDENLNDQDRWLFSIDSRIRLSGKDNIASRGIRNGEKLLLL